MMELLIYFSLLNPELAIKSKKTVFFVSALSSIKSNIDNSNCILVQDVKAVTHAQGIRDALSTSSPSDG